MSFPQKNSSTIEKKWQVYTVTILWQGRRVAIWTSDDSLQQRHAVVRNDVSRRGETTGHEHNQGQQSNTVTTFEVTLVPDKVVTIEVANFSAKLRPRKAASSDGISNNASLRLSYFPEVRKQADVVHIPKANQNHSLPKSCRPINLLSDLEKLFEKPIL